MSINWAVVAEKHAKSGHALMGASAQPRLMRCTASLRAAITANLKTKDTEFTIEGSRAHYLHEVVLNEIVSERNTEASASDYAGVLLQRPIHELLDDEFVPSDEMIIAVQESVDWCRSLPGEHYVERRASLDRFRMPLDFQFGTADHVAIDFRNATIYVTDFKYGIYEQIWAEGNEQGLTYVLAMLDELDPEARIKRVVVRISQPRLGHFDEWECGREDVISFSRRQCALMEEAIGPKPVFRPSRKACIFCPVSGRCEAQKRAVLSGTFGKPAPEFTNNSSNAGVLNGDDVGHSISLLALAKVWITATMRQAMEILSADPNGIPGYKVVEIRKHRRWHDLSAAEKFLLDCLLDEEQIEKRTMITPAQAEKLLTKQQKVVLRKSDLIVQPRGGPTLASIDDKREVFSNFDPSEFDEFEVEEGQ